MVRVIQNVKGAGYKIRTKHLKNVKTLSRSRAHCRAGDEHLSSILHGKFHLPLIKLKELIAELI